MKQYLFLIKKIQTLLLALSIIILMILPEVLVFAPQFATLSILYTCSHVSLFLVMVIRPLTDLFPHLRFLRPLVILRKGVGVFSASIIVSIILSKIIIDPSGYLGALGTTSYWSLQGFALFAHLADIAAVILLITSNNLSKRILGTGWKTVQKLSYVYFYGSTGYLLFALHDLTMLFYISIITTVTVLAFFTNQERRRTYLARSTQTV